MASALHSVLLPASSSVMESSNAVWQLEWAKQATGAPFSQVSLGSARRGRPWQCKPLQAVSCCSIREAEGSAAEDTGASQRRSFLLAAAATAVAGTAGGPEAQAVSGRRASREKAVPESEYTTLPSGLKIYDVTVGSGPAAVKGSRVAVHYVAKWKGLTFMTSRQGMGVTGGTPYGFDVGSSNLGFVLKGLDMGVEGMRVGGERLLIVPPELAYGNRGVQEIPPGATLEFNVELLSIKQDAFGSRVKLVEG